MTTNASTRIQSNDRVILTINGIDYAADLLSYSLENDEADKQQVSFAEAAEGGARAYTFKGNAYQSLQEQSLWRQVWANTGLVVPYRIQPKGNPDATKDAPHFYGTVKIGQKPTLGGDASTDGTKFTFEFTWDIQEEPTLDDGTNTTPSVLSVSPAAASAGDIVILGGSRFTGVSKVTFGNKVATGSQVRVNSDGSLSAVIPAGVTGTVDVVATNASGDGTAFAYSAA